MDLLTVMQFLLSALVKYFPRAKVTVFWFKPILKCFRKKFLGAT